MMHQKKRNLAIITPLKPTYSETFIRAHIEQLPCNTHLYYSLAKRGYHPIYNPSDQALFSDTMIVNYLETAIERLTNPEIGYWLRKRAFKKDLIERGIDAVMTEYGPTGSMIFNDCADLNIPLIVHFHGRDAYHYKTIKKYGERYRKMFKEAKAIIVVSNEMKAQVTELGCPNEKIFVSPCGPNSDFDLNIDLRPNPFQFISTGRFVAKKAPLNTIRAFHKAWKVYSNAKLVMLANGPLLESSKNLVKELKLEGNVEFLGPRPKKDIIKLFKNSFSFVQHSVRAEDGDSEGTPVSILEAMLAGLAVVSTRHAGIKDIIVENESGYLVDEGNWEAMGEKMIQLMSDKENAFELAKNARQRVLNNFTLNHHLEKVWTTIKDCIE